MNLNCAIPAILLLMGSQDNKPPEPVQTLEGHTDAILSIAFSRDGKQIATGGADKFGRVWNVSDGEEVCVVTPGYAVTGISFSKDGKALATGSWGGQVWEIESKKRLKHLESHTGFVTCASYSPSGKMLATAGLDGTAKLYDLATWEEVKSLTHGEQVNCMAFSFDGKVLATAGDTSLKIWDTETWQDRHTSKSPPVTAIAFAHDGKQIATGHSDGKIRIWDIESGKAIATIPAKDERVNGVGYTLDGKLLISAGTAKLVTGWNTSNWQEGFSWMAHSAPITCLSVSPDGKRIATGSEDKTAKVWQVPKVESK